MSLNPIKDRLPFLILIMGVVLLSHCSGQTCKNSVVTLWSIPWDALTKVRIDSTKCRKVESVEKVVLNKEADIESLSTKVDNCKCSDEIFEDDFNIRLAVSICIKGKTKTIIYFDQAMNKVAINNRICSFDKEFFVFLLPFLPDEHRDAAQFMYDRIHND